MQKQLMTILEEAKKQLSEAASPEMAEEIRVKVLGKKGKLTEILRSMGSLGAEERKEVGKRANEVRGEIENLLDEKMTELKEKKKQARLAAEVIDVTEPGQIKELGVKHPITQTIDEMSKIFMNMGFEIVEGPEVETVFMNFDALNAGPNHPSRDLTDTFYITDNTILRTQTSPVQARTLLTKEPPMKVMSPGRVYRSIAGRYALSGIPSGGGSRRRRRDHYGRSEGYSGRIRQADVRSGYTDEIPAASLPVY